MTAIVAILIALLVLLLWSLREQKKQSYLEMHHPGGKIRKEGEAAFHRSGNSSKRQFIEMAFHLDVLEKNYSQFWIAQCILHIIDELYGLMKSHPYGDLMNCHFDELPLR
jgi:hypothetical protein